MTLLLNWRTLPLWMTMALPHFHTSTLNDNGCEKRKLGHLVAHGLICHIFRVGDARPPQPRKENKLFTKNKVVPPEMSFNSSKWIWTTCSPKFLFSWNCKVLWLAKLCDFSTNNHLCQWTFGTPSIKLEIIFLTFWFYSSNIFQLIGLQS